jgi:hypothetical protein
MDRLRKLGFISYDKGHSLHGSSSLLRIVHHGDFGTATRVDAWRTNCCRPSSTYADARAEATSNTATRRRSDRRRGIKHSGREHRRWPLLQWCHLSPGMGIALPATAAQERLRLAGDGGQGLRNTAIYNS